jgi:NADH:ubiquinone oxidoreductase subunit H
MHERNAIKTACEIWVWLFFVACTRLGVCTVIIAGWCSNYGYSLLGGLHSLSQTVSYEVRLAFISLSSVVLICRSNLLYFQIFQVYLWLMFSLPLTFIWFISCLAETNRTAFAFAEIESELLYGLTVEYGGEGLLPDDEHLDVLNMSKTI